MDVRKGEAEVPGLSERGDEVFACFTAAEDAGRFVARCLEIREWPEQLRMCGERLRMVDVVRIAEEVIGLCVCFF